MKDANRHAGPTSQASKQSSDVFSQNARRRSNAPYHQPQQELDQQSAVTIERLRRFNDDRGTVAGNAVDEMQFA